MLWSRRPSWHRMVKGYARRGVERHAQDQDDREESGLRAGPARSRPEEGQAGEGGPSRPDEGQVGEGGPSRPEEGQAGEGGPPSERREEGIAEETERRG